MIEFIKPNSDLVEAAESATKAKGIILEKAKKFIEEIGADFTSENDEDNLVRMLAYSELAGIFLNISVIAAVNSKDLTALSTVERIVNNAGRSTRYLEMGAKYPLMDIVDEGEEEEND